MKIHLLTCLMAVPLLLQAQQTYTWNVPSGSWTDPLSWSPKRTTPATNDILEFSSTASVTNMPASESVAKIYLYNNAAVTIVTSSLSVITIGHATVTGNHFITEPGTSLKVSGNNAVQLGIGSGFSGTVSGNIDFFDGAHRLAAASPNSLVFGNGAVFTANTGFDGNAFGSTNLNSVVFQSGASYVFKDGASPFGTPAPDAVASFMPGSIYIHRSNSPVPAFAGRTYGYLYIDANVNFAGFGSAKDCTIQNDLHLFSGFLSFKPNNPHTGHFKIYGNIICEGATYIDIGNENMSGEVQLLGTGQTVGSGGGIGTIAFRNFTVNNSSTILERRITVNGILGLQNGKIISSLSKLLVLSATASVQSCSHDYTNLLYTNIGCNNAYIEGPVQKLGLSNSDFAFPTGINGKLRPAFLRNATGDFTISHIRGDPYLEVSNTMGAGIHHISHLEYWNITGTGSAAVELTYYDPNSGGVTDMNALRVSRYNGSQWVEQPVSGFLGMPGSNGSVTGGSTNEWGSFTLASSSDYPNNPLPIKLLQWNAGIEGDKIKIRWQASEESNTSEYVVEKSTDGIHFKEISPVIKPSDIYEYVYYIYDRLPDAGNNIYRLKITGLNGEVYYTDMLGQQFKSRQDIKIYPNPAREKIFINLPPSSSISNLYIVYISGSIVKCINTRNQTTVGIDIRNLSPGVYYIKSMHLQYPVAIQFIKY